MKIDFLGALQFAYLPFLIAMFVPDFFSTFGTAWVWAQRPDFWMRTATCPV